MGLGMRLELRQTQRLSHEQRQNLRQLLTLQQTLKHPEFPEARKGLEGIETAHEVLKRRNLRGLLIGGCAEAMWSRSRNETLESHKDVDVMIDARPQDSLPEGFEGGIDWWNPRTERIRIARESGPTETEQTWWENDTGVTLSFGIKPYGDTLAPGLYIPDRQWLIDMRLAEVVANVDRERVQLDDNAVSALEKNMPLSKRNSKPPAEVEKKLGENILRQFSVYNRGYFLQRFDLPTIVGIQRARSQSG